MRPAQGRKRSVVLLSGGLDSAANLAICREEDEPILALTAIYGQRAAQAELRAAIKLCVHYGIPHEKVELPWLGGLGGNSLTEDGRALPQLDPELLDDPSATRASARAVWVPNRNGVLISAAAAYAERRGAEQVVVGFNAEEAATFPDNTVEFIERSTRALELSTATHVRVACYTAHWDKTQIVRKLRELRPEFPFEMIWSCYQDAPQPCGVCESCLRLNRALAGV